MPHNDTAAAGKVHAEKKALFITGASGFLGSRILQQLEPDDYSRFTLLSRSGLNLPKQFSASDNVTIVRASIHDVDQYASQLDSNTIVLHLAAITGKAAPQEYYQVNVDGTAELLKASKLAGVAGFLFVSSIAVSFDNRRGYYYADSKQQAEQHVRESGLRTTIVRPTIILGDGSPIWNSFSGLSQSSFILLPGSGKVMIQPVYIDDVVNLLLGIISNDRFVNETLELGGAEALTMDDFVRRIHGAYCGKPARIVHLPLGMIVGILRIVERLFPTLLPVSSGQFSSFYNDGTAVDNDLSQTLGIQLKTIDGMLECLTGRH